MKEKIEMDKNQDNIIVKKQIFNQDITEKLLARDKNSIMSVIVGFAILTEKIYTTENKSFGSLIIICLDDIIFNNQKYEKGTIIIIGDKIRKNINFQNIKNVLILFEDNYLPDIYRSVDSRLKYMKNIQNILNTKDFICPQKCLKLNMIGSGCYGNVYKTKKEGKNFAIKITCLNKKALENPYSCNNGLWHEVYFLSEILKPLVEKKICPNLPLIYSNFSCPECSIIIDNEKKKGPCVSSMIELASGNLKNYFKIKRTKDELYSCLFQIFAGLYTIQKYAQIMNYDVKKENVLFYDIEPGGYWKYIIFGKSYYVPNLGSLFVLNDFGISRSMDPSHIMFRSDKEKTFRLGSRFAFVKNKTFIPIDSSFSIDEKGDKISPIKINWDNNTSSFGCEFRLFRKNKNIIPIDLKINNFLLPYELNYDFFSNSDIFPPFEFFNDTQDVIRMFIGGKRTTQKGNHRPISNLHKSFSDKLKKYLSPTDSMNNYQLPIDPSKVMAGYFIESFFSCFRKTPSENSHIIEEYFIS